jgi:4'-phosphopantetheinyl transferase
VSDAAGLDEREVRIYLAHLDGSLPPGVEEACLGLLSPEEEQRRGRYLFERHRREFLRSRALVRTALARHAGVDPRALRFSANEHGRPELAHPRLEPRLRFNLSHTDGLAALAVVLEHDVGVDVEMTLRRAAALSIADRFFSPEESRSLTSLPACERPDRFFDLWTLKEAYIKARGVGLALPLGCFSFRCMPGVRVSVAFDPSLEDDPAAWQFLLASPTPLHRLSLAVKRGLVPDLAVRIGFVSPIVGEDASIF